MKAQKINDADIICNRIAGGYPVAGDTIRLVSLMAMGVRPNFYDVHPITMAPTRKPHCQNRGQ